MLLEHGYHGLGLQSLLDTAEVPRGSFYHHFADKEDFALQVVDWYMQRVHAAMEAAYGNCSRKPLERVRDFLLLVDQSYANEGYMGCMMGSLGQELAAVSPVFGAKIDWCFNAVAERTARVMEEARVAGDLPADTDSQRLAALMVDFWEGAALRCRLRRSPEPLYAMLDFFFGAVVTTAARPVSAS